MIALHALGWPQDPRFDLAFRWTSNPSVTPHVAHAIKEAALDPIRLGAMLILPRDGGRAVARCEMRETCAAMFSRSASKVLEPLPPGRVGLAILDLAVRRWENGVPVPDIDEGYRAWWVAAEFIDPAAWHPTGDA
jgi:hypothetical protein